MGTRNTLDAFGPTTSRSIPQILEMVAHPTQRLLGSFGASSFELVYRMQRRVQRFRFGTAPNREVVPAVRCVVHVFVLDIGKQ